MTVITSIGRDHTAILGDTLEEIAAEKAGIIKQGVPVLTAVHQREGAGVIKRKVCGKMRSVYIPSGDLRHIRGALSAGWRTVFAKDA